MYDVDLKPQPRVLLHMDDEGFMQFVRNPATAGEGKHANQNICGTASVSWTGRALEQRWGQ
jgi:hypothetical protein